MAWTAEDRRKYAPAIQEVLRRGMLVRLAATVDTLDPPPEAQVTRRVVPQRAWPLS